MRYETAEIVVLNLVAMLEAAIRLHFQNPGQAKVFRRRLPLRFRNRFRLKSSAIMKDDKQEFLN